MEYVANFVTADVDPVDWARRREAQGWDVLGCADHFWSGNRAFPHVWVTLGAMAVATERVLLTTGFANNLFRSPVEFAQASLQMQAISGGRFEAGLGAGWTKDEAEGSSLAYPAPRERATMFREAIEIVRALFSEGSCTFEGERYRINARKVGPLGDTRPPLVASLGGARTVREIAPLVDRVELTLISAANRDGTLDPAAMATISESHLTELVERVRAANPTVPLGVLVPCSVGDDRTTKMFTEIMGDSFIGRFFGEPAKVADNMRALADAGISRIQVSPFTEASFDPLAAELF